MGDLWERENNSGDEGNERFVGEGKEIIVGIRVMADL